MIACETDPMNVTRGLRNAGLKLERVKTPATDMDLVPNFLVAPGEVVSLNSIDPSYHDPYSSRETALPELRFYAHRIDELQYSMYAEKKHSLLIALQGIDAGGKDGIVRHLLTIMNPAGCRVVGFKQPTAVELGHDFLWRIHPHVPVKGEVVIFNRSHYEDVLTVRVHRLVAPNLWSNRYELINDFERLLVMENNTTILKFFLHISKEEQLARFKQRLDDPARRWKISECDYRERAHWDDYMKAFEDMLNRTSTRDAPWYVIPSNNRWYRDLAISQIITRTLEKLEMKLPEPTVDIPHIRHQYFAAEKKARQDRQFS